MEVVRRVLVAAAVALAAAGCTVTEYIRDEPAPEPTVPLDARLILVGGSCAMINPLTLSEFVDAFRTYSAPEVSE